MKCSLCNHYHPLGGECVNDDNNQPWITSLLSYSKPDPVIPPYVPPTYNLNSYIKPDPIIPSYEPPTYNLNTYIKPDPIIPSYEPPTYNLNTYIKPDPIIPSYEPPTYNLNSYIKPDPIIPPYEPPTYNINTYIKPEPILPLPPSPVHDIGHNLIGWKSDQENFINTGNGSRLNVDPGGFVRDPMDNLVGQMGPLNTLMPPSLPQMPDYGPPQSDMQAWDPGYSPLKPF